MYVASNATVDCHKGSKCMEKMIGLKKIKKKADLILSLNQHI